MSASGSGAQKNLVNLWSEKKKKKKKPNLTGSVISVTNREAHQCLKMGFSINLGDVNPGDVGEIQT